MGRMMMKNNKGVLLLEFDDQYKNYYREKDRRIKKFITNFISNQKSNFDFDDDIFFDITWEDILDYCLDNKVVWGSILTERGIILLNNNKISFLIKEPGFVQYVIIIEKEDFIGA